MIMDLTTTHLPSCRHCLRKACAHVVKVVIASHLALLVLSVACGRVDGVSEGPPAWSPDGSKIAFVSGRDGNPEIYVMDADGASAARLTENDSTDGSPTWSPDGRQIAFVRYLPVVTFDRNGEEVVHAHNAELFVMSADGGGQRRLTFNEVQDIAPSWSPDGSKIAFVRSRSLFTTAADGGISFQSRNPELLVMNPDGSNEKGLASNARLGFSSSWSPDGRKIAFVSDRDGNGEIYVIGADGDEETRLTEHAALDSMPSWSPDGKRIAFSSRRSEVIPDVHPFVTEFRRARAGTEFPVDGNFKIYVINVDGSGIAKITTDTRTDDVRPAWSPDGRYVLFDSRIRFAVEARRGNNDIYTVRADGSELRALVRNLSNNPDRDRFPSWSPDGRHIAFVSQRSGREEVMVTGTDAILGSSASE
jgi:TolB protein